MTDENTLSIDDLVEASGQSRRNIRFLISEGVVPEPIGERRWARYGPQHLHALKVYSQAKERGISSLEIIKEKISVPSEFKMEFVRTDDGWEISLKRGPIDQSKFDEVVNMFKQKLEEIQKGESQ